MKIAILYADFGSGHRSVSNNLMNLLNEYEVEMFNARKEKHHLTETVNELIYNKVVTKNADKKIVKNTYDFTYKLVGSSTFLSNLFVKHWGYRFIEELIEDRKPNLIISTFPHYISNKQEKNLTIITDFTIDNTWYDEHTQYYFVPCQEVKNLLLKKNVKENQIFVTGIPLQKKFDQTNNKKEVKSILFNLGARGQANRKKLYNSINHCLSKNLQVTIMCGSNKKLYNLLKSDFGNLITIYNFTDKVDALLKENDLIITKAGGLSVSECIMSEKPLIINFDQSLKGQEMSNCDYVHEKKIGLVSKEKDMIDAIDFYVDNPDEYIKAIDNIRKIKIYNQEDKIKEYIKYIMEI